MTHRKNTAATGDVDRDRTPVQVQRRAARSRFMPTPPPSARGARRTSRSRRGEHAADDDDQADHGQRGRPGGGHHGQRAAFGLADRASVAPGAPRLRPRPARRRWAGWPPRRPRPPAPPRPTPTPAAPAASQPRPAKTIRSDARSPTSLSTNPQGRVDPAGPGHRPVQVGAGQPGGQREQRAQPPAVRDADRGQHGGGHPGRGEHVRGHAGAPRPRRPGVATGGCTTA